MRKIGKGANASVFAAVRLRDSIVVAIKAFSKSSYFGKEDGKGKVTSKVILGSFSEGAQDTCSI